MNSVMRRWLASIPLTLALPLLLVAVFTMHLRNLAAFLDFRLSVQPAPADRMVKWLLHHGPQQNLLQDPHVIAYLGLPLFLLTAVSLYLRARDHRPLASAVALGITLTGTIYLGGLFGMWTSFRDGLSQVDPRYADGLSATYAALTAPRGAFLLTTTLAKLSFVGLLLQGLALWQPGTRARVAALCIAAGSALFLLFWDLDNWMLAGSLLLMAGMLASRKS